MLCSAVRFVYFDPDHAYKGGRFPTYNVISLIINSESWFSLRAYFALLSFSLLAFFLRFAYLH